MNLEKLQKAQQDLESIVKESKLNQAHEQAQNMAVGMGLFTLPMPFIPAAPYVLVPLAIAGGITFLLNMDGAVNLITYKTDPERLEPEPIVDWDEEEVTLVQKGFPEIKYNLKKAESNPQEYLSQQLQYHQQMLIGLKQATTIFQALGKEAVDVEAEVQKSMSLTEDTEFNRVVFWQKLKLAPLYWMTGTTRRAKLQQYISTFTIGVARLEVLKEFFDYGKEFFRDISLKLGEHSELAQDGAAAAQELAYFTERTLQAQKQYRDFHQKVRDLFYPKNQPLHRWLPF